MNILLNIQSFSAFSHRISSQNWKKSNKLMSPLKYCLKSVSNAVAELAIFWSQNRIVTTKLALKTILGYHTWLCQSCYEPPFTTCLSSLLLLQLSLHLISSVLLFVYSFLYYHFICRWIVTSVKWVMLLVIEIVCLFFGEQDNSKFLLTLWWWCGSCLDPGIFLMIAFVIISIIITFTTSEKEAMAEVSLRKVILM